MRNSLNKHQNQKMKHIKVLKNPKTEKYTLLKNSVCSRTFPWFWDDTTTAQHHEKYDNFGFYFHGIHIRPSPGSYYCKENSNLTSIASEVIEEILTFNNINLNIIYRISVNCVHSTERNDYSVPHKDHDHLDHKNLLIYYTDCNGGDTKVKEDTYLGKEDDVITWDSQIHQYRPPSKNRRIVLVATYL